VLGAFPFLSKTLGILAGYGITFYIVVQALNQIVDLYGQRHTFLDNCKTVVVYAPGKVEDAKVFTEIIGKESVVKESLSSSGSRYAVALNNLNASSQEVARDLMNPDELMKLPPTEALILNQGMPPYIAKKVVYCQDKRFRDKAYSRQHIKQNLRIGFLPIPFIKTDRELVTGFLPPVARAELELEVSGLPSAQRGHKTAETVKKAEPRHIEKPDRTG
jgi:type IV secretion system protein VirD4